MDLQEGARSSHVASPGQLAVTGSSPMSVVRCMRRIDVGSNGRARCSMPVFVPDDEIAFLPDLAQGEPGLRRPFEEVVE